MLQVKHLHRYPASTDYVKYLVLGGEAGAGEENRIAQPNHTFFLKHLSDYITIQNNKSHCDTLIYAYNILWSYSPTSSCLLFLLSPSHFQVLSKLFSSSISLFLFVYDKYNTWISVCGLYCLAETQFHPFSCKWHDFIIYSWVIFYWYYAFFIYQSMYWWEPSLVS